MTIKTQTGEYHRLKDFMCLVHSVQVYTVDARNHGETQHTPEMTYDLMSRDTLKFIQDQGLDKVILIG